MTSSYRCPEHIDNPVTWRGTGCPDCAYDRRLRFAERARRRRAIREARLVKAGAR